MFIKNFQESYNYGLYGKGNPDYNTAGGALARATVGLMYMVAPKLFSSKGRYDEALAIKSFDISLRVLPRIALLCIVLTIVCLSPDLIDLSFEKEGGFVIFMPLLVWIFRTMYCSPEYDERKNKDDFYNREMIESRTADKEFVIIIKWSIIFLVGAYILDYIKKS